MGNHKFALDSVARLVIGKLYSVLCIHCHKYGKNSWKENKSFFSHCLWLYNISSQFLFSATKIYHLFLSTKNKWLISFRICQTIRRLFSITNWIIINYMNFKSKYIKHVFLALERLIFLILCHIRLVRQRTIFFISLLNYIYFGCKVIKKKEKNLKNLFHKVHKTYNHININILQMWNLWTTI